MRIEKETVIAKKFVKNSFLNKPLGEFTQELGNANFNKVMNVIKTNKSIYTPNKAIKHYTPEIYTVFRVVGNSITKDNKIDRAEIYNFVKGYYNKVKHQNLTDEQISNLKIADLLDITIIWVKNVKDRYLKAHKAR